MKRLIRLSPALLAAVSFGCPSPASNPAPGPSPTPTAAAAVSPSPVASNSPAASPSNGPSTVPTSEMPPATVTGRVYDEAGQLMADGTEVTLHSVNPSNPYEATVSTVNGVYVCNSTLAGVLMEVTARRPGWTSRTHVETFMPTFGASGTVTTLDFGGPTDQSYFLSEAPEVAAVEPAVAAKDVDPTKLLVKLTLSEPLDATNQRRFARAIRVFPANSAAAPQATDTADLNENPGFATAYPTAGFSNGLYTISEGSTFMGAMESAATVTWNMDGNQATLAFPAPLITDKSTAPRYQVALISAGPSEAIQDKDGHPLGGLYEAGALIQEAFKAPFLQGRTWADTHVNASYFELARDTKAPTLASVAVLSNDTETRITLAFSEAMGAFNGKVAATGREIGAYNSSLRLTTPTTDDGIVPNGLTLTFGLAETTTQAAALGLDGHPEASVDATAETPALNTEFGLKGARLAINPQDPRVLYVYAKAGFLPTKAHVLKVRAEGLTDPAGNMIEPKAADSNIKTGTF